MKNDETHMSLQKSHLRVAPRDVNVSLNQRHILLIQQTFSFHCKYSEKIQGSDDCLTNFSDISFFSSFLDFYCVYYNL